MFENFSADAIKVVMYAQEEARRLKQSAVGVECLLMGLLRQFTGIAGKALVENSLTEAALRKHLEKTLIPGDSVTSIEIPFTYEFISAAT
jgi:ATP-dependent Clp protease ATP-binding subunit ClpC